VSARFGWRVGDDGRWHGKTDSLDEANAEARKLSLTGWLGKGQVVDFQTGDRAVWTDGERTGGRL
jgi:hypothetical protein